MFERIWPDRLSQEAEAGRQSASESDRGHETEATWNYRRDLSMHSHRCHLTDKYIRASFRTLLYIFDVQKNYFRNSKVLPELHDPQGGTDLQFCRTWGQRGAWCACLPPSVNQTVSWQKHMCTSNLLPKCHTRQRISIKKHAKCFLWK